MPPYSTKGNPIMLSEIAFINTITISTKPETKKIVRSLIAVIALLVIAVKPNAGAILDTHTQVLKKTLDPQVWKRVYYLLDIGRC